MLGRKFESDTPHASYLFRFFRQRLGLVVVTLALLVVAVIGLAIVSGSFNDERSYVVNVVGRQRMLSLKIAQDANRMAALYAAVDSDLRINSVPQLQEKLRSVREDLRSAIDAFGSTIVQLEGGRLLYKDKSIGLFEPGDASAEAAVGEVEAAWSRFKPVASAIADSAAMNRDFRSALIVINDASGPLLLKTEDLSDFFLGRFRDQEKRVHLVSIFLFSGLALICVWLFFGSYKLILEPYRVFYVGLRSLGGGSAEPRKRARRVSPLMREVDQGFAVLRRMVELLGAIGEATSFTETLHFIFATFKTYIPYNYIGVATFVGYSGDTLVASYGESDGSFAGLPERLLGRTAEIGTTSLGAILESGRPRIIGDLAAYARTRPDREYTRILLEEGVRSSITLPLEINGKAFGFLFFSSKERDVYTEMHVAFLRNIRNAIALSFERVLFVDELVYSSTLALAKMAEARDEDTASHLDRMRGFSVLLTRLMRDEGVHADAIDPEYLRSIDRFSPMHDIGKVGIRDAVLLKPGKLDAVEMAHMKTHTIYGASVLQEAEDNIARTGRTLFRMGIRIAESHHERWDGTGYPHGLAGEAIPLEARIVAVADVLDALTTRRPYKEPFGFDDSFDMIIAESGSHFEPAIVGVFAKHRDEFMRLYDGFKSSTPGAY